MLRCGGEGGVFKSGGGNTVCVEREVLVHSSYMHGGGLSWSISYCTQ